MKPVVSAFSAWACIVLSIFAIVILSTIAGLFKRNHHSMMGEIDDPVDGAAVASSIFTAVIIYVVFLIFCGLQALLHSRESRRGQISLH